MKLLFWLALGLTAYTYFGYAALLWCVARFHHEAIPRTGEQPSISIIMAARNEAASLTAKLENLKLLDYPAERLQVIVASDGSTDRTAEILEQNANWITPVLLPHSGGKARALNEAVRFATGDLLVFLDVRQRVNVDAVSELAACFASPQVGAASGELLLEADASASSDNGMGIYWKIEKMVRKLESASGSVVGATGAIYAVRRELYVDIPGGTILDDVFVPMNVARLGRRVVFQPSAIARDRIFSQKGKEFSRKVRTLTGNYQLLQLAPWLLSPANPLLFRFISHKLMRLLVPFLLVLMLVTSVFAGGRWYQACFALQLIFYGLAAIGEFGASNKRFKAVSIAHTFTTLNLAAAIAFYNFVAGREKVWG